MYSFQNRTISQVVRNSIDRRHRLLSVCRSAEVFSNRLFPENLLRFVSCSQDSWKKMEDRSSYMLNFQEQHQVMADVDEEFEGVTRRLIQFDHVISSYFYIVKVVFNKVV